MPRLAALAVAAILAANTAVAEPVGGRWSLEPGHDKPRYVFRDGDQTGRHIVQINEFGQAFGCPGHVPDRVGQSSRGVTVAGRASRV